MTTFYVGYRNVLKGRNDTDAVNPYKKKVAVYSNYSIYNPSHVLDGAPDKNHLPGDGYFPHDIFLSRRFRGLDTQEPMDNAGDGVRLSYGRFRPLEYKGLSVSKALGNPGHAIRHNAFTYSFYTTNFYVGLDADRALNAPGHAIRYIGAPGTANSFGAFNPYIYKGTSTAALKGGGKAVPAVGTDPYGFEHTLEWFGVPSSKAL